MRLPGERDELLGQTAEENESAKTEEEQLETEEKASKASHRCRGRVKYQEGVREPRGRKCVQLIRIFQLSVYRHIIDGSPPWLVVDGCGRAFSSG